MIRVLMISRKGDVIEDEGNVLIFDTTDGQRSLLPRHMPIIYPLSDPGILKVKNEDSVRNYRYHGGVLYFEEDEAKVLSAHIEEVKV